MKPIQILFAAIYFLSWSCQDKSTLTVKKELSGSERMKQKIIALTDTTQFPKLRADKMFPYHYEYVPFEKAAKTIKISRFFKLDNSLATKIFLMENFPYLSRYYHFSQNAIQLIKETETIVKNYGGVVIYSYSTSPEVTPTWQNSFTLIHNSKRSELTFLPIQNPEILKIKKSDTDGYIGGVYIGRSLGYFFAYEYINENFRIFFDHSPPADSYELPIFASSQIEYNPHLMKMTKIDRNNDTYIDLVFRGNLLHVFNSEEILNKPIEFVFLWNKKAKTWKLEGDFDKLSYSLFSID